MLYTVIGKPGEGKSYWCVSQMYEKQQVNIANLKKNIEIYYENKTILADRGHDIDSSDEYTFKREINVKENDLIVAKIVDWTFQYNEFLEFEDEEQFEKYFELSMLYNDFIIHINELYKITLATFLPVRQIYSDINGLKIEGVLPLPSLDWRETPLGSIMYIDECRKKPPYKFDTKTPSKDPIIIDMAEVRHYDKDVYLISQDAEDINISLRQLVDKLYFIKRPSQKPQACSLYTFDKWLGRPRAGADSKRDPKPYVEHELIIYKKKYFAMYKSASSHTSVKFKLNWKIFGWILLTLSLMGVVAYGISSVPIFGQFSSTFKQMLGMEKSPFEDISKLGSGTKEPEQQQTESNPQNAQPTDSHPSASEPTGSSTTANASGQNEYKYDVRRPYDFEYDLTYQIQERPRLAGCIISKKTCSCYTQQATKIDMSQSDCKRYMSGDRPFDYFTKQQDLQRQQAQPQQVYAQKAGTQQASDFDREYFAKIEQAKQQGLI
ncbi:phage-related protein [Acinetobacter sp. neg1]|uniref:zonular occludens toxin domain-containing protein n=1 Tax=Acinetobacter sp. neg1 TaxID=1561068 RepID=UPI0005439061|nr:zonular occludens toxin domain-containing protein [Acinetobacter sp. neg1]KHF77291.1 phage-related protein [Acinetobacter sp. neg1]